MRLPIGNCNLTTVDAVHPPRGRWCEFSHCTRRRRHAHTRGRYRGRSARVSAHMSLSRHDRPRVLQHVVRLLSLRTDARGEATVLSLSLYLPARRDAIWPPVEDEATGSCSPSTYADATGEAARPPLREPGWEVGRCVRAAAQRAQRRVDKIRRTKAGPLCQTVEEARRSMSSVGRPSYRRELAACDAKLSPATRVSSQHDPFAAVHGRPVDRTRAKADRCQRQRRRGEGHSVAKVNPPSGESCSAIAWPRRPATRFSTQHEPRQRCTTVPSTHSKKGRNRLPPRRQLRWRWSKGGASERERAAPRARARVDRSGQPHRVR